MLTIIEAAVTSKMKRLVVTSSFAAVAGNLFKKEKGDAQ